MMTATDWARELSLEPEGETAAINSPRTLSDAGSGRGNEEKMVPHFFRMIVYLRGVG